MSATLKDATSVTAQWCRDIQEFSQLCGGLLAIVHPNLFRECIDSYDRFREDPATYIRVPEVFDRALEGWANPFSGLALISNRATPTHRDNSSRDHWYDVLTTLGRYENLVLSVPETGLTFSYDPGTMVALSGRALEHMVPEANGERVCFAYFVRDKVHAHAGSLGGDWPTAETVLCDYRTRTDS